MQRLELFKLSTRTWHINYNSPHMFKKCPQSNRVREATKRVNITRKEQIFQSPVNGNTCVVCQPVIDMLINYD